MLQFGQIEVTTKRLLWTKTNNWYIYDRCKQDVGLWSGVMQ